MNKDGRADRVAMFRIAHTGIKCGDTAAPLTAKTSAGALLHGGGNLRTTGCGP